MLRSRCGRVCRSPDVRDRLPIPVAEKAVLDACFRALAGTPTPYARRRHISRGGMAGRVTATRACRANRAAPYATADMPSMGRARGRALPMDEATRDAPESPGPASANPGRPVRSTSTRPDRTWTRGRHARASRSSCPSGPHVPAPPLVGERLAPVHPASPRRQPNSSGCTTCTFDIDPPPSGYSVPRQRLERQSHVVGYASAAMPAQCATLDPDAAPPLPADDPAIFEMDLRGLRRHWADRAALPAISAETMTGADRRAQALGYPGLRLMEHAGTAVAAAVRALASDLDRWGTGPIVILCGPGNNGGDGFVAARRLALAGASVDRRSRRRRRRGRAERQPPGTGTGSRATPGSSRSSSRSPATSPCSAWVSRRRRSSSMRCSARASAARCANRSAPRSRSSAGRERRASRSSLSTPRPRSTSRVASPPTRRSSQT